MRIIDADTHLSPTPERGVSIMAEELISRMDRAGVAQSLTWLTPPYLREVAPANRYIYDSVKRYPDRLLGFGWVDPNLGVRQSIDEVKRCVEEYGFYGVKLNGAQNTFYIDHPELSLPVIEEIAKTGTFLAFHVGADDYDRTHPYRVAKIARRFPEMKILMAHMGGAAIPDLSEPAIEFAQECPNLYLIASSIRNLPVVKAIQTLGPKRVLFGSDTPFDLMHVEVKRFDALLDVDVVDQAGKADIMGGNLARLFGLDQ